MEIRITNVEKIPKLDLNLNLIKVQKLFKQFPDVQIELVELKQTDVINSVYFRCRNCNDKGAKYDNGLCEKCEKLFK